MVNSFKTTVSLKHAWYGSLVKYKNEIYVVIGMSYNKKDVKLLKLVKVNSASPFARVYTVTS